ncbi:sigma factor-like helix-turn-helix DNA-binding protein [Halobacillus sp. H74]|uniref:sigma factor-like helix-turn-helix DNA-binding protein n=1 Tax=Halobacillus sp. H74 TaxID=3457436 RepID=UPI003FCEE09A
MYKSIQYVLESREQLVLNRIYGVDAEIKTMSEIGKEINVTLERVRQIRYKAHRKIVPELN